MFTKYAAQMNLGKPEEDEFDITWNGIEVRVQPFTFGIVYAEVGKWGKTSHIGWF